MCLMLTLFKGAVSGLDSERVCSSSQLTTATESSSGEGQLLLCLVLQLTFHLYCELL